MRRKILGSVLAMVAASSFAAEPQGGDGCTVKNVDRECFSGRAQMEFLLLKLTAQNAMLETELGRKTGAEAQAEIGAALNAATSRIEPLYKALVKKAPKQAAAARSFLVTWKTALAGIPPAADDTVRKLEVRHAKHDAELTRAAVELTTD